MTARDLRGSRRDLALVFSRGKRTAHEAAKELGRPTGSIFGVIRRMHAEGLLIADSDPDPPTRGTSYHLAEDALALLDQNLAPTDEVGRLGEGQRVVFVERKKNLATASEVLAARVSTGLISWGAELPGGWLLVMVADADPFQVSRLVAAFERAGCRCRDAPVDALASGPQLRQRAATRLGQDVRR